MGLPGKTTGESSGASPPSFPGRDKGYEFPQHSRGTYKRCRNKNGDSLINQLTQPFKPEEFKDEFSAKLIKVIEAKSKGKGATVKQMKAVTSTTTIDLMEKLKESLKTPTRKKAS